LFQAEDTSVPTYKAFAKVKMSKNYTVNGKTHTRNTTVRVLQESTPFTQTSGSYTLQVAYFPTGGNLKIEGGVPDTITTSTVSATVLTILNHGELFSSFEMEEVEVGVLSVKDKTKEC
jgi:hypothetical protein